MEEYGIAERWKNKKWEKERGTENGRYEVNEMENATVHHFYNIFHKQTLKHICKKSKQCKSGICRMVITSQLT